MTRRPAPARPGIPTSCSWLGKRAAPAPRDAEQPARSGPRPARHTDFVLLARQKGRPGASRHRATGTRWATPGPPYRLRAPGSSKGPPRSLETPSNRHEVGHARPAIPTSCSWLGKGPPRRLETPSNRHEVGHAPRVIPTSCSWLGKGPPRHLEMPSNRHEVGPERGSHNGIAPTRPGSWPRCQGRSGPSALCPAHRRDHCGPHHASVCRGRGAVHEPAVHPRRIHHRRRRRLGLRRARAGLGHRGGDPPQAAAAHRARLLLPVPDDQRRHGFRHRGRPRDRRGALPEGRRPREHHPPRPDRHLGRVDVRRRVRPGRRLQGRPHRRGRCPRGRRDPRARCWARSRPRWRRTRTAPRS